MEDRDQGEGDGFGAELETLLVVCPNGAPAYDQPCSKSLPPWVGLRNIPLLCIRANETGYTVEFRLMAILFSVQLRVTCSPYMGNST